MKTLKSLAFIRSVLMVVSFVLFFTACSNPTGNGGNNPNHFHVANAQQWQEARMAISNGGNDRSYIIDLVADITVEGLNLDSVEILLGSDNFTFGGVTGVNVTIRGNHTISLQNETTGMLLAIRQNQTVIIQNTKFRGHGANNNVLVHATDDSTLVMQGGSAIYGNTANSGINGGGMNFRRNANFTMRNNSSVHSNTANWGAFGGGVLFNSTGIFEMHDNSSVYGNTAIVPATQSGRGAGVFFGSVYGTFHIVGGTVYGDTVVGNHPQTGVPLANTFTGGSGDGASLFLNGQQPIATYGSSNTPFEFPQVGVVRWISNTITGAGIQP